MPPCLSMQAVDLSCDTCDISLLEIVCYSVKLFCTLALHFFNICVCFLVQLLRHSSQMISIGFRSGLYNGHSNTRTFFVLFVCLFFFSFLFFQKPLFCVAVCYGSLFCCSHPSFSYNTCAVGRKRPYKQVFQWQL